MPELPPVTIATFPLKCIETSLSVVKLLFNDHAAPHSISVSLVKFLVFKNVPIF
jgi:hypothetical protein